MIDLSSSEEEEDDDDGIGSAAYDAAVADAAFAEREAQVEARATCALYDRGRHCCKFDGSCFRRNAAHFLEFRHPQEMQKAYCPNLLRTGKCSVVDNEHDDDGQSHKEIFSHHPLPAELRAAAAAAGGNSAAPTQSRRSPAAAASSSSADASTSAAPRSKQRVMPVFGAAAAPRAPPRAPLPPPAAGSGGGGGPCGGGPSGAGGGDDRLTRAFWRSRAPKRPTGNGKLADRFGTVPFDIIDAKKGPHQARKKQWHAIIDDGGRGGSTLGRKDNLIGAGYAALGGGRAGQANAGTSEYDPAVGEFAHRFYCPKPSRVPAARRAARRGRRPVRRRLGAWQLGSEAVVPLHRDRHLAGAGGGEQGAAPRLR